APGQVTTDVQLPLLASSEEIAMETKIPVYGFGASPDELGRTADVEVKVTGLQFAWIFNYPTTGITDGELHIPVGQNVQLDITAQDVIHSFWVPQFRLKQDAIPGETTELRFVASKPGTYPVVCTELCGSYHGAMRTQVIVHTPEEYSEWVQSKVASSGPSETIALGAPRTEADYLGDYSESLGIDPTLVAPPKHMHMHSF
ncbi:cytochrome c oxidase subunit II, partial [filamentous cyanobacterium CCP5]